MEVVVQEKVQALVHEEVASALDALALIVHASALELSWKTTDDVRSLRDVLWKRTYGYETRTIETAVLRLGSHAVVLATEISGDKQRDSCTSWEVSLDKYIPAKFLPMRASNVKDIVHGELIEHIVSILRDLNQKAHDKPHEMKPPRAERKDRFIPEPNSSATPSGAPTSSPLRVGDADRDPLVASGHPPFPGGSGIPAPLGPQGDGMIVGPSHPMFGGFRGPRPPVPGPGPWGGDGFLPPNAVPPGARFDPVGPFPGNFPRPPLGPGGPRGPSGDPDWDDMPPPGGPGSMYL